MTHQTPVLDDELRMKNIEIKHIPRMCRAHPLGTASPTPLQPDRPRTMFSPRLPMRAPARLTYLSRCVPVRNAGDITDKKQEDTKRTWNMHAALGFLLGAAKSKMDFHIAVGGVLLAAEIAVYLASLLKKSGFMSNKVKVPKIVITAAAMTFVLGKSMYSLLKQTKDIAGLVLHFISLYKESLETAAAASATSPASVSGDATDSGVPSGADCPSPVSATLDTAAVDSQDGADSGNATLVTVAGDGEEG